MPVHGRVTSSIKFAGTHLYTWVERGTVGVLTCVVLGLTSAMRPRPPCLPCRGKRSSKNLLLPKKEIYMKHLQNNGKNYQTIHYKSLGHFIVPDKGCYIQLPIPNRNWAMSLVKWTQEFVTGLYFDNCLTDVAGYLWIILEFLCRDNVFAGLPYKTLLRIFGKSWTFLERWRSLHVVWGDFKWRNLKDPCEDSYFMRTAFIKPSVSSAFNKHGLPMKSVDCFTQRSQLLFPLNLSN